MNKDPKIGIITMHKVLNYGSALQAFALQKIISDAGYRVELIDYIFPNKKVKKSIYSIIKKILLYIFFGVSTEKKQKNFNHFYSEFYCCSKQTYYSSQDLVKCPPKYDIYITGSDQVWNPTHIKNDNSFLLDFAPDDAARISYASSFSTKDIDENLTSRYAKYLSRYKYLSVREQSGKDLIYKITSKTAEIVCDPTLLLTKENWEELITKQELPINKPYILAYILRYAYDPYPEINKILNDIQRLLGGMRIVFLDWSFVNSYRKGAAVIKNSGPLDFINLISNAAFVITTSFHGTAFAINLEIPFYSVVSKYNNDTRITDLLEIVGAQDRAISYDDKNIDYTISMDFGPIREKLSQFRDKSKLYLFSSIQNATK